jgi:citrate synthase
MPRWLTAPEAARELGVRRQTLYAYVSRGLLTRHPGEDRRTSLYDAVEVAGLAERAPRRDRTGVLEFVVDTEITALDPEGTLTYRGRDAVALSRSARFEDVAALLWGAGEAEPPAHLPWAAEAKALEAGRAGARLLAPGASLVERMRVVAAVLPSTDPLRADLRPEAVRRRGRILIAALVDSLPSLGEPRNRSIAARLWAVLSPRRPRPAQLAVLDAALVLLADHELAVSTLGARVAASARADPYLVVAAALGILGGGLHGGSATAASELLAGIPDALGAPAVVGRRLASGRAVPGFGHAVYRRRDPRADELLERLAGAGADQARLAVAHAVIEAVGRDEGPAPNVDFALAVLVEVYGLAPGSAEAIFATARCAGWIAHAIEEYPHRLRFRGRAAYLGPRPARAADGPA